MSIVRVYRSTDPGAPAHPSATRGSMAALIRACLVDGYGSGSINIDSLSISGGVGTAAITTNSLDIGTRILIAGANEAELNAEWRITAADSSSVTLDMTGVADQTASGTITASIPGAGWEEPYTESNNYACFHALSGVGQYFQIDDNNTDADVSILRAFDTMSSVDVGASQRGEVFFGKHYDASYLAYGWIIIADEKTCYTLLSNRYGMAPHCFGEFFSYVDSDTYKSLIVGHQEDSYMGYYSRYDMVRGDAGLDDVSKFICTMSKLSGIDATYGNAAIRTTVSNNSTYINGKLSVTDPLPGVNYPVEKLQIKSSDMSGFHGEFRGIYVPMVFRPKSHGDIFNLDNKLMLAIDLGGIDSSEDYMGQFWFDISESWEESQ